MTGETRRGDLSATTDDDPEFDLRSFLHWRGIELRQFHPFTIKQLEALAAAVKESGVASIFGETKGDPS